jgi:hypothetical protein
VQLLEAIVTKLVAMECADYMHVNINAYIYIHTHKHTCTHTHIHTHIHKDIHTYMHAQLLEANVTKLVAMGFADKHIYLHIYIHT